ncbi:hypothetical protein [Pseudolactococcus carnosus]|uniref:Uncharacterized protein n=1 Tax=Pseudolactococcus carnosus TaxID=2749961 RepID=A0ABT0AUJ7_9LACT|nr:hypothetical protein [Lactococcus carnosus]MCJ1990390.1 hypothetical protein [Lactococcus carnosus]
MMRKIEKKSRGVVRSEDGSVLIIALGIIVLLFVVVVGIFYFAVDTQKNIVLADRYTKLKDAKSYAIEESKTRLMAYFDEEAKKIISEASNASNDSVIKTEVEQRMRLLTKMDPLGDKIKTPFFSSRAFGVNQQYQFKVGVLDQVDVKKAKVYGSSETGGWSNPSSSQTSQEAKRITVPINIELVEKKGNSTIQHDFSSRFVYEVQWENVPTTLNPSLTRGVEFGQLDTWRNIFYNHYANGENGLISADTWTRLLYRGYRYQAKKQVAFDEVAYNSATGTYVFGRNVFKDSGVVDTKLTDTASAVTSRLTKTISGGGSLIIEDTGLNAVGKQTVTSDNMIAVVSDRKKVDTEFKGLNIKATTGMLLSRYDQKTTVKSSQVETPSWLITQTRKKNKVKETALSLDDATIKLNKSGAKFDYNSYLKKSALSNPQLNKQWSDMLKGGLVIGSSVVELVNNTTITLGPESNFMLTNASIKENAKGEESFNYQSVYGSNGAVIPNPPSILKIGAGTSIVQDASGFSFIDAPKRNRRNSLSQGTGQSQDDWIDAAISKNRIEIASGGKLALGMTGIEPFDLKLAKDAEFSFYATSDTTFFDTSFIKAGEIKGKLIIYTWDTSAEIGNFLDSRGIKHVSKSKASEAVNGEVTVITQPYTLGAGKLNVVRTFGYLVDVDFMKKK